MSEEFDPLTTADQPKPVRHRDILLSMAGVSVISAAAGFAFGGVRFGLGVLFGSVLAFANYFWLDRSTRAIFAENATASTAILALKYVLRYAVIGGIVFLVYATGAFPVPAVILGLAIFAFAVVFQGLKNIFTTSF